MVDDIISVFTLALIVGALYVAVRPGSQTPAVVQDTLGGFSGVIKAATGQ